LEHTGGPEFPVTLFLTPDMLGLAS
jgi:hypothetical protein